MTIPANSTMMQRCEEIRALLAFERPENPETNEIEWQSFLHRRHDLYTKFPYDSDDEDEDDAKTQKRQLYSNSDTKPEKNSFLRLTEALPVPSPQAKPIKLTPLSFEDPETEKETINTRLRTTLTQSSLPNHTLQSSFNTELALLTSRYAEFSLHSSQRNNGENFPLLVDTYELIGDTLSLCAFFLTFPILECEGMEFAEVLKNGFWLSHTTPSSPLLQLFSLRLLSLTLHLFHPMGLPGPGTPATPAPDSILHSWWHIDLYEKAASVFEDAGMSEVAERYGVCARWGWLCVGGDEGGI
ncbi:uncharacterized protein EAE97_010056 [Botrytis byssoidea]|uniref:Uncharacterized protein n=1 Tax=Botrytis byssoidea TaxID=139641 RepID=A0A9P5LUL0_9HELO|nr:uncharacterized protein EAE97_010056 [Botrytis byssoidea]KAF7927381.1 hypothetical protein EAE97_010056 [Botrytis byssoidea]